MLPLPRQVAARGRRVPNQMFRVALTFALLTQTTGLLAPLESYEQMMAAHPLETKAFTQAALWSVSDCIAQRRWKMAGRFSRSFCEAKSRWTFQQ